MNWLWCRPLGAENPFRPFHDYIDRTQYGGVVTPTPQVDEKNEVLSHVYLDFQPLDEVTDLASFTTFVNPLTFISSWSTPSHPPPLSDLSPSRPFQGVPADSK